MFYDLNVQWKPHQPNDNLPRTLAFLHELGYNVVALNHTISGKLPADLTNPIPSHEDLLRTHKTLPPPSKLTILRRITLTLTETSHQNARVASLASNYDILALRPVDEKTLQLACSSLDCDIITLDLTQRLNFFFKHKMLQVAISAGKRIEICYAQGLLANDAQARRSLISNATQLIRATRGRGMILSSGVDLQRIGAVGCRGPWDVVNLAAVWGLGQERGYEAVSKEARSVVVMGKLKRTGYRGAVDVVYGGERSKEEEAEIRERQKEKQKQKQGGGKVEKKGQQQQQQGQKRKAEGETPASSDGIEKPMSKRQQKKLAHAERVKNGTAGPSANGGAENSAPITADAAAD
ncbi:putative RNase P subunit p30, polymerase/histidinol phosphatase [Septoria linicola]|nr:putative RNase P subunit p30, polymerase/histidinol phosphatase [Septoria linicola]